MNKFEVINHILQYIEIEELEKANDVIKTKQRELATSELNSRRLEINEIIKMMQQIDIELMRFELKKMQLTRLCPDSIMTSLENYMLDLINQRKQLAEEKKMFSKLVK
ncbi:hypothetical protein [uncultured Planococcus sp.]|uniref:hypothetical protein n=1 Tax=uncultured Planococcus sp. TaxID=337815 RepID=UPI002620CACA|nr:hypothetical protein [uncultured Planococcus sp.]